MAKTDTKDFADLNADVAAQLTTLRADISALTSTVAEFGAAQGVKLKANAQTKASDMAEAGYATASAAKAKAEKTYSEAEDAVRANPSTAVGIAAGIGFLVGMLTARK